MIDRLFLVYQEDDGSVLVSVVHEKESINNQVGSAIAHSRNGKKLVELGDLKYIYPDMSQCKKAEVEREARRYSSKDEFIRMYEDWSRSVARKEKEIVIIYVPSESKWKLLVNGVTTNIHLVLGYQKYSE